MPVAKLVGAPVTGRWKPSLALRVLPGCPACRHPHPLALKPAPSDTDHCAECGAAVAPAGEATEVPALGAWPVWLANAHHWLAEKLLGLAKRI